MTDQDDHPGRTGNCVVCGEPLPRRWWWPLITPLPVHRACRARFHREFGNRLGWSGRARITSIEQAWLPPGSQWMAGSYDSPGQRQVKPVKPPHGSRRRPRAYRRAEERSRRWSW